MYFYTHYIAPLLLYLLYTNKSIIDLPSVYPSFLAAT